MWLLGIIAMIATLAATSQITGISGDSTIVNQGNIQVSLYGGSSLFFTGDFTDLSDATDLNITVGDQPCVINPYWFNGYTINCVVPGSAPLFSSKAKIVVKTLNGSILPISSSINQYVNYEYDSAPMVWFVNPPEATPAETIAFVGSYNSYSWTDVLSAKLEGLKQITLNIDNATTALDSSYPYDIFAVIGKSSVHGDSNPSLTLKSGNSGFSWIGRQAKLDGSPYFFRVLSRIDSVSSNLTSDQGGLDLTITGAGFPASTQNSYDIKIDVDGTPCTLKYHDYNKLICTTQPGVISSNPVYSGNAGLYRQFWNNTNENFQSLLSNVNPTFTINQATTTITRNENENNSTRSRMWGLFRAPTTGNYTFFLSSDDGAQVFLSNSTNPQFVKRIINFGSYLYVKQYYLYASSVSAPIPLVANQSYYFEIWHYQGGGSSHFEMGVQVPSDGKSKNKMPLLQNLVITPPQIIREVQSIKIPGNSGNLPSGSLGLAYNGVKSKFTTNVDPALGIWNCSGILSMLYSINIESGNKFLCNSTISGTDAIYNITFDYPLTTTRKTLVGCVNLRCNPPIAYVTKYPGTTALGGNFTVSFNGGTSGPIDYWQWYRHIQTVVNKDVQQVQNQLMVYGSQNYEEWNFNFMLPYDLLTNTAKLLTLDLTNITGGGIEGSSSPNQVVYTTKSLFENSTDQFFPVIPSDFLRTYETTSQLHVTINGVSAVCWGNCSVSYVSYPNIPIISSYSVVGNVLTFDGVGFLLIGNTSSYYSINVGNGNCNITALSNTSITCELSVGIAGDWIPVLTAQNIGTIQINSSNPTLIHQSLTVSSITPDSGSVGGGTTITVTGTGFVDSLSNALHTANVTIGSSPCIILTTSTTSFTCVTTKYTSNSILTVFVDSISTTSNLFAYSNASSPNVTSITPTIGSTITTTSIVIEGAGFSTNVSEITVSLGEVECLLTYASLTQIKCNILGGPPGVYPMSISIGNAGFAIFEYGASNTIELVFKITQISPNVGSIYGGTLITVKGEGFSLRSDFMLPFFWTSSDYCTIKTIYNNTQFTCVTPAVASLANINETFGLYGRLSDLADCLGNCTFFRTTEYSPTIKSVSPTSAGVGDLITLYGSAFGSVLENTFAYFSGVNAEVVSVNDTQITVIFPNVTGNISSISLYISDRGYGNKINITNLLVIKDVQPKEVSQGGEDITVYGSGFLLDSTVYFSSIPCNNVFVSNDRLTCKLGPDTSTVQKPLIIGSFTCSNLATCGITQTIAKTFQISSASGSLTINGNFPSVSQSLISVHLNTSNCYVTSSSTSSISCTPDTVPGTYNVCVHIEGYGYSTGTVSTATSLLISTATSLVSSYQGGLTLNLTGTSLNEKITVEVCNSPCDIIYANGDSLSCILPAIVTNYSQTTFDIQDKPQQIFQFTPIASYLPSALTAYDQDLTTSYYDNSNQNVFIGLDIGSESYFKLTEVRFTVGGYKNTYYKDFYGTIVQGSLDGVSWDNLTTITDINNYWNSWIPPVNQLPGDKYPVYYYRFYRFFISNPSSNYAVNEIQWYGIAYINSTSTSIDCPIVASYETTNVTISTQVQYNAANTPTVTSISPLNGTILGNTSLTVTGTGFGSDSSKVTVTIDGVLCKVTQISDTVINCLTGARSTYRLPSFQVFVSGKGYAATGGNYYLYADLWSSHTTWGGEVPPRAGETVSIPAGFNIILDVPTGLLNLILIEGSLLVEDKPGITIDAYYIFINGGTFQIGTESHPYKNDITITIHGDRHTLALPSFGNKCIAVMGGLVDIHGLPKSPSWTTLLQPGHPGDITITLSEPVIGWNINDEIVVASTSYDYTDSEVFKITGINSAGNVLTLDHPMKKKHYANTEIVGSDSIEIRAEVGVLTRNIKITGGDEGLSDEYGVHFMFHSDGDETSKGRLENLEIFHAGQSFNLGRYPIHFHMIGKVSESYIRNNSIHDTFNRAVTIHGVHYLTIMNNVANNVKGHTYFIEDGIESQNRIENNLGLGTYPSWSLLNTDQAPATFWITNPNNFWINNHAAGGSNYGFWISLDPNPTGPSATATICPRFTQLGAFVNNTSHTYGKYGLRIFQEFYPLENPCAGLVEGNAFIKTELVNHTAWKCGRNGAIAEQVGDVRLVGFKVADNILAGIEVTYAGYSPWYTTTRISDAVVIGNTGNTEHLCGGAKGIVTPQTDGFFVENVRLYNFDNTQFIFGDESHSVQCPVFDGGARLVKLAGIKYYNSNQMFHWGTPQRGFFEFTDTNSFVPQNTTIAAFWTHLITPDCSYETKYNAIVCNATIRRVTLYNISPGSMVGPDINILRTDGKGILSYNISVNGTTYTQYNWSAIGTALSQNNHRIGGKIYSIPLVTGYTYSLFWGNGDLDLQNVNIEQDILEPNDWFILHINFTQNFTGFVITRGFLPWGANASDPTQTNVCQYVNRTLTSSDPSCTYTFDNITKYIEIIISGRALNSIQTGDISLKKVLAPPPPSLVLSTDSTSSTGPKTVLRWSDNSTWGNTSVPTAGSNVFVNSDWHLILDQDTPVLSYLEVNGILEFDQTKNISLNSQIIYVRGGQIISGNSSNPLPTNTTHQIVLFGTKTDNLFYFSEVVPQVSKVLVVAGSVQLFGNNKVSYSMLEQNAYPGDTVLFVDTVDWNVGDTIVVTPSDFNKSGHEIFTIVSISQDTDFNAGYSSDSDWIYADALRNAGKNKNNVDKTVKTTTSLYKGLTKITLSSPLKNYHSGASIIINETIVDMRSEVALLNRNIKIRGDNNGWPALVMVTDFWDIYNDPSPVQRNGNLTIDSVQFDYLGQPDGLYAGLSYYNSSTLGSSITNSLFTNSQFWSVYINTAFNFTFVENVIFNSYHRGFVAEYLKNGQILSNLIISTYNPANSKTLSMTPSIGLLVCFAQACDYKLFENTVVGGNGTGIGFGANNCSSSTLSARNNLVRSTLYGIWASNVYSEDCIRVENVTVSFTEFGFQALTTVSKVQVSNLVLAENKIGSSVILQLPKDSTPGLFSLSSSIFVGKTIHSYCDNCWTSLDCKNYTGLLYSSACKKNANKLSLFGDIMIPVDCGNDNAVIYGYYSLSNNVFSNYYYTSSCSLPSFAITTSNSAPDFTLPLYLSSTYFINSDSNSRIYFFSPNPVWLNEDQCGRAYNCTGPLNILITDLDGKFTGFTNGGYLLPNNPGIVQQGLCTFYPKMNGYLCDRGSTQNYYQVLAFHSNDDDSLTRTFSPINITTWNNTFTSVLGGSFYNQIMSFMDHSWSGFYTLHQRKTLFPNIIYTGQYLNLSATSNWPNNISFYLLPSQQNNITTQPIIVSLWYQNPQTVAVYQGKNLISSIPPANGGLPSCTFTDSHGTNQWFNDKNVIQFVMKTTDVLYIVKTASLQLNLRISMTLTEFYSNNGPTSFIDRLSSVLQIPSWRIRIVNVVEGSVIANISVLSDPSLADSSGVTSSAEQANLNQIQETANSLYSSGLLSSYLNVTVLSFTSSVATVTSAASQASSSSNGGSSSGGSSSGGSSSGGSSSGGSNWPNSFPGSGNSPTGSNAGLGKANSNSFKSVMDDWVVAIFAGIVFLLIAVGSLLFTRSKNIKVNMISPSGLEPSSILPNESVNPLNSKREKPVWYEEDNIRRVSPEDSIVA